MKMLQYYIPSCCKTYRFSSGLSITISITEGGWVGVKIGGSVAYPFLLNATEPNSWAGDNGNFFMYFSRHPTILPNVSFGVDHVASTDTPLDVPSTKLHEENFTITQSIAAILLFSQICLPVNPKKSHKTFFPRFRLAKSKFCLFYFSTIFNAIQDCENSLETVGYR
jgi:hypothetical protein